jgi:hypothetical protein
LETTEPTGVCALALNTPANTAIESISFFILNRFKLSVKITPNFYQTKLFRDNYSIFALNNSK